MSLGVTALHVAGDAADGHVSRGNLVFLRHRLLKIFLQQLSENILYILFS